MFPFGTGQGRKLAIKLRQNEEITDEVKRRVIDDIQSDVTPLGEFLRGWGFLAEEMLSVEPDSGICFLLLPTRMDRVKCST